MPKRGNGEGSIVKLGDRWQARVTLPNGKRKAFYAITRAEASRKLTDALKASNDGLPVPSDRLTVGKYLEEWLEGIKPSLRPRTWVRYREYVRIHAIPSIGRLPLSALSPQRLSQLYAKRLEAGSSAMTVRHLHAVLHKALAQATEWNLVVRNVADLVKPPRAEQKEMMTLSPEEARRFLDAATSERLGAIFVLALSSGLRQGELLALKWRDMDLESGSVHVRATLQRTEKGFRFSEPKTAKSKQQVLLTPTAIAALKAHRIAQAEERLRLGPAWEDMDLVFANEVGRPIEATNLIRRSFRASWLWRSYPQPFASTT